MTTAILGLGLIGGSLGLALRVGDGEATIVGWDPDPAASQLALDRGAVTAVATTPAVAVAGASLVILAAPVRALQGLLREIAQALPPTCVVTDVASTKAHVVAWAREAGVMFVGGHPMAGTEKTGVGNARVNLFRGATWCVTPETDTPEPATRRVEDLARAVGARPLRLSPADHDAFVAAVSHLPFVASSALTVLTARDPRWAEMAPLAATGYRDATRLASGSPTMYGDICATNGAALAPLLRDMASLLTKLADEFEDDPAVDAFFTEAKAAREAWLAGNDRFRLPS